MSGSPPDEHFDIFDGLCLFWLIAGIVIVYGIWLIG